MKALLYFCVALWAHAALAAENRVASAWLKDYMNPTATVKASSGPGHESIEKEEVCFQQSSYCPAFCANGNPCTDKWERSTMASTPCHEEYYGETSLGGSRLDLSKCLQHRNVFAPYSGFDGSPDSVSPAGIPLDGFAPGLSRVGSFTASCFLKEGTECHSDGDCKEIVVEVQGSVFRVAEAVRTGPPPDALSPQCPNPPVYPPLWNDTCCGGSGRAAAAVAPDATKATIARAIPDSGHVPIGQVEIYSGEIVSTSRHDKFTGGTYQYSWFIDRDNLKPVHIDETRHMLVFPDEMHKFQFLLKDASSY